MTFDLRFRVLRVIFQLGTISYSIRHGKMVLYCEFRVFGIKPTVGHLIFTFLGKTSWLSATLPLQYDVPTNTGSLLAAYGKRLLNTTRDHAQKPLQRFLTFHAAVAKRGFVHATPRCRRIHYKSFRANEAFSRSISHGVNTRGKPRMCR